MLEIFGDPDPGAESQMWRCLGTGGVKGVLCADKHKGYAQPVGGVVAYDGLVSISGVGFDIGCGNTAVRTRIPYKAVKNRLPVILGDITKRISFGIGRPAIMRVRTNVLDKIKASPDKLVSKLIDKAAEQLGTVGSGNHYVDLFVQRPTDDTPEDDMPVWIGVHFGSRGFGHTIAKEFLKLAGGKDGMDVAPTLVDPATDLGARYVEAMVLAGEYAKDGRWAACEAVLGILAAKPEEVINNHHNYAWQEEHDGQMLWVVRKGATPAFPGQKGFVGGSMGDDAVIIEGVDSERSKAALYSTVHGAGRIMSRGQAKKTFTREEMDNWLRETGVLLHGGDLDESPMAYRRLHEVLAFHEGTINVLHKLRPIAVAMAGRGDFDPYKD